VIVGKKVCLSEPQMEHIIDAVREDPDACPTAIDWVDKFRPKQNSNPVLKSVDRYLDKRVQKIIRNFNRWF